MFTNADIDTRVLPASLEPEIRVAAWCWEATVGIRVLVHMAAFPGTSVVKEFALCLILI